MLKAKEFAAKALAKTAKSAATKNANSTCGYMFYQKALPKAVQELRKF